MTARTLLALPAFVVLAGSLAYAADVRTDYDHSANFSQIHTYSWSAVKTSDPLYQDRIKSAVDKDLQAKGWQMVPSGGDATIFATGDVRNEQQLETTYNGLGGGWGGRWGWGGWGGGWGGGGLDEATTTTTNQPVGHLVGDVFDTSNHKLLFRGISDDNLSKKSSTNTKKLDKDLNKMFKKFPPKAKG